jgi:FAD binding domain
MLSNIAVGAVAPSRKSSGAAPGELNKSICRSCGQKNRQAAALAAEDQGVIMQFHLNGFEPGDPEIFDRSERHPASGAQGSVPEEVDVLIVGSGPAGLTLAAQLSAFPDIKTCIVEQKSGRMQLGQADASPVARRRCSMPSVSASAC